MAKPAISEILGTTTGILTKPSISDILIEEPKKSFDFGGLLSEIDSKLGVIAGAKSKEEQELRRKNSLSKVLMDSALAELPLMDRVIKPNVQNTPQAQSTAIAGKLLSNIGQLLVLTILTRGTGIPGMIASKSPLLAKGFQDTAPLIAKSAIDEATEVKPDLNRFITERLPTDLAFGIGSMGGGLVGGSLYKTALPNNIGSRLISGGTAAGLYAGTEKALTGNIDPLNTAVSFGFGLLNTRPEVIYRKTEPFITPKAKIAPEPIIEPETPIKPQAPIEPMPTGQKMLMGKVAEPQKPTIKDVLALPEPTKPKIAEVLKTESTTENKKTVLFKGEQSVKGNRNFGEGQYTSTSKDEAARHAWGTGKIIEYGEESMPKNPKQFKNQLQFETWFAKEAKKKGIITVEDLNREYGGDKGKLISELGYDGVAIKIKDGINYVKYPEHTDIKLIDEQIKNIEKEDSYGRGTGFSTGGYEGQTIVEPSARPKDIQSVPLTQANKRAIAKERLENGYNAYNHYEPPNVDYLIATGKIDKAIKVDKTYPQVTMEEYDFYKKVVDMADNENIPDTEEIQYARKEVEKYEKRQSIFNKYRDQANAEKTAGTQAEFQAARAGEYEAEQARIKEEAKKRDKLQRQQAEEFARRTRTQAGETDLSSEGLPLFQGKQAMPQQELFSDQKTLGIIAGENKKIPSLKWLKNNTEELGRLDAERAFSDGYDVYPVNSLIDEGSTGSPVISKIVNQSDFEKNPADIYLVSKESKLNQKILQNEKAKGLGISASIDADTKTPEYDRIVDSPELVKFMESLIGERPQIKNLDRFARIIGKPRGIFKFSGNKASVYLDPSIFENPKQVAQTLAHEIGHLVDWLPDKTLSRGNILGHIASLRKYTKRLLKEFEDAEYDVLTTKDRARIRREAERIASGMTKQPDAPENMIDPAAILNVWNSVEASETNPALLDYIKRLSTEEKRNIIKSAIEALRKGEKVEIKDSTKFNAKYEKPLKEKIKDIYTELLKKEINKRRLFERDVIVDELKALSKYWKPFNEYGFKEYTDYRFKNEELYADAISVMLNDPASIKRIAPTFYRAFYNYLDKKPEVQKALSDLDKFFNMPESERLKIRQQDIRSMFERGEEKFAYNRDEWKRKQKSLLYKIKTELYKKEYPILSKIIEARKKGVNINPENNPEYYLEEYTYIGGKVMNLLEDVQGKIIDPVENLKMTSEDIGEYMFLKRIVNDRSDIANPLGQNRDTAQKQLEYMADQLGAEKIQALDNAVNKFQSIIKKVTQDFKDVGGISASKYESIAQNQNYATFQVLDYLSNYVTPSVIGQKGTFKDVANPFVSTTLKMISTLRATERIKTNNSIIRFMQSNFPTEIKEAEYKKIGKIKQIVEKPEVGIIKTRKDGQVAGYYVDPYIANSLDNSPVESTNAVIQILRFMNKSYFKPVYVNLNLGFQSFNLVRDLMRSWKLNPDKNIFQILNEYWKAIPVAKQALWGITPDVVKEMREKGMIGLTYNDVFKGATDDEQQIDYLMRKYRILTKDNQSNNPAIKVIEFIENLGNIIERIPKIAGYKTRQKSGLHEKEFAHEVRVYSGSPDFMSKGGGYDWYNNLFLFANAIKEGIRGDIEGSLYNPRTRFAYWYRTALVNILPKIVMFMATAGMFGKAIQENYRLQSEYDKTNYTTMPLGVIDGKALYLRIPQDEVGRVISAIFWKSITAGDKDILKTINDVTSITGGQIPSLAPGVELIMNTGIILGGQNPYDFFRGRTVLSDDEMAVGGWYKFKGYANYMSDQLNLRDVTKITTELKHWEGDPTTAISNIPIIRRFLKYSDSGDRQLMRNITQEKRARQSERTLQRKENRGF